MASNRAEAAVFRALIFEPPVPADSDMEPEVSTTREISSSMPLAWEWTETGIAETPSSWEK